MTSYMMLPGFTCLTETDAMGTGFGMGQRQIEVVRPTSSLKLIPKLPKRDRLMIAETLATTTGTTSSSSSTTTTMIIIIIIIIPKTMFMTLSSPLSFSDQKMESGGQKFGNPGHKTIFL